MQIVQVNILLSRALWHIIVETDTSACGTQGENCRCWLKLNIISFVKKEEFGEG